MSNPDTAMKESFRTHITLAPLVPDGPLPCLMGVVEARGSYSRICESLLNVHKYIPSLLHAILSIYNQEKENHT